MPRIGISTGTIANDGTGTTLKNAGYSINSNFEELYNFLGDGTNINISSSDIALKSDLAQYALITDLFDRDYNSLVNTPILFDGDYDNLTNKPTLFDGDYYSLTNIPPNTGGGASVTIGDSAPANSLPGDLWWKADEGRMKVYYNDGSSAQWVDASPTGGATALIGGGTGISIEEAADAAASLFSSGTHSGISFTYDDQNNKIDATVSGGGIDLTAISVTTASPSSGGGSLVFDDTTGVFTFTPADISNVGGGGGGSSTFLGLTDTPSNFLADKYLAINSSGDAIEFVNAPIGAEGPRGPQGPQGLQGPVGTQGLQGDPGQIGRAHV